MLLNGAVPLIKVFQRRGSSVYSCLLQYYSNRLNNDVLIKGISSNVLLALLFVNVLISLNLYAVHSSYKLSYLSA